MELLPQEECFHTMGLYRPWKKYMKKLWIKEDKERNSKRKELLCEENKEEKIEFLPS